MATSLRIRRRSTVGAAGAPASLLSAELAYNMSDGIIYVGFGDNGSGVATSVKAIAKDDFLVSIPVGGTGGQALVKNSATNGDVSWATVTAGGTYTASGDGIELTATNFSLNYAEIATGINLASKLNLAGGTMTGKLATVTPGTTTASLNLPHGVAPTVPVNGDVWTTTSALLLHVGAATKTVAFTDSNITGSAASLATPRNFSLTGGVSAAGVAFNGSANVALTAAVDAGHITLARMANLAASSLIGNSTGVSATPTALTASQVKTLLAVAFTDLTGTASAAQVPSLDAAKITTGVFDVARIPVLPGNTTIVATTNIASLDAGQQASIEVGTIVTTSDGRRWVYNTGSKTLEASYVELADTTPEWSVIANKPDFATVATSGGYADLTGKPTLGTMSTQSAAAVAITGGTIDGVTLDGGTF